MLISNCVIHSICPIPILQPDPLANVSDHRSSHGHLPNVRVSKARPEPLLRHGYGAEIRHILVFECGQRPVHRGRYAHPVFVFRIQASENTESRSSLSGGTSNRIFLCGRISNEGE